MLQVLITILIAALLSSARSQGGIVYPSDKEQLATKINCQTDESQHFRYSSATNLWGIAGGQILLNADVALHCLGDDKGGKYQSQAVKYLVQVSNLLIEQKKTSQDEPLSRQKRGVGDFVSKTWKKVKNFFNRMFGRTESPREQTVAIDEKHESPPDESRATAEEEEEDFNMVELSPLYSVPFQFVQLVNGSIPEIRFAAEDTDGRVKNFKRHLVDTFATQLDLNNRRQAVVETSVMGEHVSTYNVTLGKGPSHLVSLAGFTTGYSSADESTVMVEKRVTEGDILKLAPNDGNEAKNDRDKMDLKMQQMQIFKGGRMLHSRGTSSLILLHDSVQQRKRRKRDDDDDVMSYFQAHSAFDMQLQRRQRRSVEHANWLENQQKVSFASSSRFAEVEDNSAKQKLQTLQKSIRNATAFFESLLKDQDSDYDENIQILFEMVEREVSLKLDNESHSVSKAARKLLTQQKMQSLCSQNFTKGKDFLQLLALAGGPEAEEVLLSFLSQETHNQLSKQEIRTVADIISDTSKPTSRLLTSLSILLKDSTSLEPEVFGSLVLSTGHLASSATEEDKRTVSNAFVEILRKKRRKCNSDPVVIDVLEAMGNLGHSSTVPEVLRVSVECSNEDEVQIACAHALRHSTELPEVQQWMRIVVQAGKCDVTRAVIGTLSDKIYEQEMNGDAVNWPRYGFNDIDSTLRAYLQNTSSENVNCNAEDVILYFNRKKDPKALDFSHNYFGRDSEPWNPGFRSRQRRAALWDDVNCQEWTEDNKYRPIQDKEEFASDRATYNKRKSCLASRRLGVKGANAEIYAGMFAGVKEPSKPPKFKLFTKFVSGLNFLGHQMEIGSFYFYLQGRQTKAYVRIMGRTRQEFTHEGCTPTDLRYRPLKHIPLFLMSISAVQVSLGIHLSSQLALDTVCPSDDVYQLVPFASVRVGGDAVGTVLFARGALNLAGNFNYKLQFTFTPSPNMCLKGNHGYDPMSISFEAFFQLWNVLKNDWGKFRVWKPNSLSWQLNRGSQKPWFDDTCIVTDTANHRSTSDIEKER